MEIESDLYIYILPCILACLVFIDLACFRSDMSFIVIVEIIAPSELMCFVCKLTLNKTLYVLSYLISYGHTSIEGNE